MYSTGRWQPSFNKIAPGSKHKSLTLYACDMCNARGFTVYEEYDGFTLTRTITDDCPTCKGTGKNKRVKSVQARDYYRLMKKDRLLVGMPYKGKS